MNYKFNSYCAEKRIGAVEDGHIQTVADILQQQTNRLLILSPTPCIIVYNISRSFSRAMHVFCAYYNVPTIYRRIICMKVTL